MEIKKECLQRQQMILKFLGYYQGACDGIWSEKTIAAKRDFEVSGKFHPAYPNNGMPFDPFSKLPSGIMLDFSKPRSGMLIHVDISKEYYAQLEAELVAIDEKANHFDPNEKQVPTYDPLLNQTVGDSVPAVAVPVVTEQLIDKTVNVEPVIEPEQTVTLVEETQQTEQVDQVVAEPTRQDRQDRQDRHRHFHQNKPR